MKELFETIRGFRSWLGYLNFFLLQWFFIRVARSIENEFSNKTVGFGIMVGIVPMTGWTNDYKFFPWKTYKYIRLWGK